jgi:replicative DNA helicase
VIPVTDYTLERGLPASIEAERSILGSILLDSTLWPQASASLAPDHFSLEANRRIYSAMLGLDERGNPIDTVTLVEELTQRNEIDAVKGFAYLSELIDGIPDRPSIEHYIRIVLDKSTLRGLINVCQNAIGEAIEHPEDASAVLGRTEQAILQLAENNVGKKQLISLAEATAPTYNAMFQKNVAAIKFGLSDLDHKTSGGIWREELCIIGGDPGSGKSAFASQIAAENARDGKRVAIFSIEMRAGRILRRLWCYESGLFYSKLKQSPKLLCSDDAELLDTAIAEVANWPIYVNDSSGLSPQTFAAQARHAVLRDGVDLIILDHIQLMTSIMPGSNEVDKVMKVSAVLRQLAKDYCPVIALSQLSRQSKDQRGQRPVKSDLKGSSALEQDASVILMLWRPNNEGEFTGEDEIIVAKNREGEPGVVYANFEGALMRYMQREIR